MEIQTAKHIANNPETAGGRFIIVMMLLASLSTGLITLLMPVSIYVAFFGSTVLFGLIAGVLLSLNKRKTREAEKELNLGRDRQMAEHRKNPETDLSES